MHFIALDVLYSNMQFAHLQHNKLIGQKFFSFLYHLFSVNKIFLTHLNSIEINKTIKRTHHNDALFENTKSSGFLRSQQKFDKVTQST